MTRVNVKLSASALYKTIYHLSVYLPIISCLFKFSSYIKEKNDKATLSSLNANLLFVLKSLPITK